ncbi:MAG: hypothetical protein HY694_03620 [Deltaproteobacteria bacterium]|nr:hypothetical protein [Deltaproteobacteria bacterium]
MAGLEEASVRQNIVPLADFLARLVDAGLRGKTVAKVPAAVDRNFRISDDRNRGRG